MAAGDRKIKLLTLSIPTPASGEVIAEIRYRFSVEDKVGQEPEIMTGTLSLSLGTPAAALAMTLGQIRTAAISRINADATVPVHDSAS